MLKYNHAKITLDFKEMDIVRKKSQRSLRSQQPKKQLSQKPPRTRRRPPQKPPQKNDQSIETLDAYIKRTRVTEKPKKRKVRNKGKKIFWCAFLIFFISACTAASAFLYKTNQALEKISDNNEKHSVFKTLSNIANPQSYKSLNGFDEGRINILLLGRANSHKSGKDLTDTIMMASINTEDYTVGLFSLPRDFLISNGSFYRKINTLYQTGLRQEKGADYIIESVEEITDQKIHYYVVMDFEGFVEIINILDGINVDVPRHIRDERYPGPGYSYETFEVYPGLQKFDGDTALKYARTRHDVEGDFGRAKRQQQIMQAARNKAFSLGTIIHPHKITEIFTVLSDHLHTNITPNEIEPFISLVKKLDTQNITNVVVDAWKPGSLLISARYYSKHGGISGLVPRIGSHKEIHERAANIFDLNKIAQRQKDIESESPTITLAYTTGQRSTANRIKNSLSIIGFNNITITSHENDSTEKTVVLDNTRSEKPFSLDELLKKLPAKKSNEANSVYETDFVIVLGDDIVETYRYVEITKEELEEENAKNNDK